MNKNKQSTTHAPAIFFFIERITKFIFMLLKEVISAVIVVYDMERCLMRWN